MSCDIWYRILRYTMDIRTLHAFRIVAESGSISAAAVRLGTVQSALSARIAQFEASVGESLFERLPRGIRLTPAGNRLLPFVQKIERLAAEAVAAAHGESSRLAGPFRLGVIEIAAASIMPEFLSRFLASQPDIDLGVVTGLSRDLIAKVEAGENDAAIVAEGFGSSALMSFPLSRLPLALIRPVERAPETLGQAFAFGTGCLCRARLEGLIHRRRLSLRIVELGSIDAILDCVEAGIGLSLLPQTLVKTRAVVAEPCGHLDLALVCRPETQAVGRTLAAICMEQRAS